MNQPTHSHQESGPRQAPETAYERTREANSSEPIAESEQLKEVTKCRPFSNYFRRRASCR